MRIKELLKKQGKTAKDMASAIGMTEQGLSISISDKGNPSLRTLQAIAGYLGVSVSELLEEPNTSTFTCPHCGNPISVSIK